MMSMVDHDDMREPAIVSFEAAEIETDTAYAAQISSGSDRGIKREIRDVAARSVLNSLCD